ncbi:hypothetical protein Tco_0904421 [Tanacetum coccineum]
MLCPPCSLQIHSALNLNPFFNPNLLNWNIDDVIIISDDDEDDEDMPMPTVENQVVVFRWKRIYSLIDESESDED